MAATRILPIVWPTLTLYWSLDVTSRKTATEFCPRGSKATPTSFRSVRRGLRSDVVSSDTNGSRRPSPSYWKTSRLINTFGAVSAAGAGAGSGSAALDAPVAGAFGAGDEVFGAAVLAAVFGVERDATCARAWAEAPVATAATKIIA